METQNTSHTLLQGTQKTVKIFIVDDDSLYRFTLEHQLKKHPEYKIYSFKSGEECLRQFQIKNPDILLLDYRLNDNNPSAMNGLEILRRVKNMKPDISVLMMSAIENLTIATNSIKNGAYDYLIKNESIFIRIENMINKCLNNLQLKKISQKQELLTKIIILGSLAVIIAPVLFNIFLPNLVGALTLFVFASFIVSFFMIKRIRYIN